MREKWVDLGDYFGPDRRKRPGPKRWSDRRRFDETSERPPLGALLRRLRVHIIGVPTPDSRRRALQLLNAAIHEAERQRLFQCAEALKQADAMLRTSAGDPADADAHVLEAMNHAAAAGQ
jgi:hypothetical protein